MPVSDERFREQAIKDVAIDAGSSPSYVRLCLSDIKRHFDDSLIFQYAVAQREQLLALREAVCGQDGALAHRIAEALFTNGQNEKASRLVLELPNKRDGGGWCQKAVEDVIREKLEALK